MPALTAAAEEDAHALKIARERYKAGLSSFIEVLDAENKRVIFIDGKDGKKEDPESDEDVPLEPRRPGVGR